MYKILLTVLSLCVICLQSFTQKPTLRFNKDGEFKIVQFTDTHINWDKQTNFQVYETIQKVMDEENPDLIVFTGDIMTGGGALKAYDKLVPIMEKAQTPWTVVFGNHESESTTSRVTLANYLEKLPYCLNLDKGETDGKSNFVLEVEGKGQRTSALIYCMDSNTYSTIKPKVNGYGWFTFDQVQWYKRKSAAYADENNGNPLPAVAFFHIPLPEYTQAWENTLNPPIGVKFEDECSPDINTGMFAAMLEAGDVMGTFVGHDHINDYIGIHHGIALAYGRVSKVMRSPEDPLAGGRVILLKEGSRSFDTWVRDMNGLKELECNWPGDFNKKPKK